MKENKKKKEMTVDADAYMSTGNMRNKKSKTQSTDDLLEEEERQSPSIDLCDEQRSDAKQDSVDIPTKATKEEQEAFRQRQFRGRCENAHAIYKEGQKEQCHGQVIELSDPIRWQCQTQEESFLN